VIRKPLVLVVEDDAAMRNVLSVTLESQGYDVRATTSGENALSEIAACVPDIMLLDLGLPGIDGIEVTSRVRRDHELPIIVISARGGESDQIRALDEGANDYVTKPFREGELLARIRVALRKPTPHGKRELVVGDLRIDSGQHRVFVSGIEIALTPIELKLLTCLAKHPDQVVTHHQLLREVWGAGRVDEVQYLRVFMRQLRLKIEKGPVPKKRILTALGVGYRLIAPDEPVA
jgi:two-component system KDP operon response regulator KdpE